MKTFNYLFSLIYPARCIFCGCLLPPGKAYEACESCFSEVELVSRPVFRSFEDAPFLDGILCACYYSGNIKKAIAKYKYYDKPSYYRFFARLVTECLLKTAGQLSIDMIVSVPLYKDRLKTRGYNQSRLLSGYMGRVLGIPEKSGILKRVRDTGYQSHLSRTERLANVDKAFSVKSGIDIKGKNLLLVDDIFTTGSTLNQCALALKQAGASKVYAVVLASTKRL